MSKVSRFAGLLGFGAKKAAEDPKDKDKDKEAAHQAKKPVQGEDESDEDFKKRMKAWEDEDEEEDDEDGDEELAEEPKDVDEKCKKAKADGLAEGIAAERSRWADTLASKAAEGRVVSACSLLADTDMNAASIQKTLAALPAETGRSTLASRHVQPTPAPAADGGAGAPDPKTPQGFAAAVKAAVDKVRPPKAKAA